MDLTDLRQRFFSKIAPDPHSACILWIGGARDAGYGLLSVDNVLRSATHVSWFLKHGVWPALKVLHTCDNPPCVNPEHLFEGTDADNAADRDAKGRHRVLKGFESPSAKLDDLQVSEIIALTETRMTLGEIGALFGVGGAYVSSLRHGRSRTQNAGRPHKPKGCRRYLIQGREMTVEEIAGVAGVGRATIEERIKRGMTGDALAAPKHKAPRKPHIRRR